jgi:hypothetical protein
VPQDLFDYGWMVENALRGVVREALVRAARDGLPGSHHFYVSFRTDDPGVAVPEHLAKEYAGEMTIVLQHQFWDLEVEEQHFSVLLSFHNKPERLTIPFAAITAFADPSVKFGLQFQTPEAAAPAAAGLPVAVAAAGEPEPKLEKRPAAEIVTLDKFRKR